MGCAAFESVSHENAGLRLFQADHRRKGPISKTGRLDLFGKPGGRDDVQVPVQVQIARQGPAHPDEIGKPVIDEAFVVDVLEPLNPVRWIDVVVIEGVSVRVEHVHVAVLIQVDRLNAAGAERQIGRRPKPACERTLCPPCREASSSRFMNASTHSYS